MRGADEASICGADQLVERARAELHILGARPRRRAFSGLESLTASQRRISDLAANGMSNRQIAQALFITQKTVEFTSPTPTANSESGHASSFEASWPNLAVSPGVPVTGATGG
jgi:hypothetical protein